MVTTFRVLGALLAGMWAVHAAAGLIDIGLQKQLFLDDHLLERKTNAERVMYQGTRVSDGPLQLHDKPWEGNYNLVRSIHQDPETGDLVLFYRTTEFTSGDGFKDEATRLCIARSDDGVHWKRPNLGLVEFEGSTENNILPHDSVAYDLYDFIYDPTASDPAKRFKGMERVVVTDPEVVERRAKEPLYYRMEEKYVEMMRDRGGVNSIEWNLYYSPDGIRWEPYKDNPVMADPPQSRRWAGPTTLMWDPIRNLYAAHIESCQHARCPMFMRLIGRSESTNMVDWSYPETIIVPDDRDPEGTQFYCFAVGAYAGLYTGVLGT